MYGHHEHPRFKAAAVQSGPVIGNAPHWFNLEATLNKATSLIAEASRNGARLIVFPETWLPCYPYWSLDVTDRAGFAEIWANFLWSSVEVPGPETEVLCKAARNASAYVVMGINERDRKYPGRMYNSILYLSPQGEILGTHRKICITVQERFFHTPGDGGDNLRTVFKTEIGSLGGSICGEHRQLPLLFNWLMQGLQVHCSLWPGTAGLQTSTDLLTRALCRIGNVFGVASATYIPDKDLPKNFYKNSHFNLPKPLRGGSGIVHPNGDYVVGPVYDEETIVYGDIDLAEADKSRFATNVTGLYSRWDLFSVNVRQETYEPIVPMPAPPTSETNQIKELEAKVRQLEQQITALSRETPPDFGGEE